MKTELKTLRFLAEPDGLFLDGDWVESKDQDPQGDVRLIQLADIGDGYFRDRSNRFLTGAKAEELRCTYLEEGDVLIARMPEPLGRACIFPGVGQPAVTAVDVCIFRPASDVDSRYVMHMINSPQYRGAVSSLQRGTTRKRISRKNLGTVALPVPPLHVQEKIVEEIEMQLTRADDGERSLVAAEKRLTNYRKSVLEQAASGRLLGLPPASGPSAQAGGRAAEVVDSGLPPLPQGWTWMRLESVLTYLRNGIFVSRPNRERKGTPILRISAVRPMKIDTKDVRYVDGLDEKKAQSYFIAKDDLLFTRYSGNREYVGACARVRTVTEPTLHPDKLIRARVNTSLMHPAFFEIAVSAGPSRTAIRSRTKTTAGQTGISGSDLKSVPIPVPPVEVQEAIVSEVERHLSLADDVWQEVSRSHGRLARLRASVLAQAFSGKLQADAARVLA